MTKPPDWLSRLRKTPLRTRRLVIRPLRRGDDRAIYPAVRESIEQLMFWMPWATPGYKRADTKRFVRDAIRAFAKGDDYSLVMFTRGGEFVGGTGFHQRGTRDAPYLEIGYWCRTPLAGRGYATESVRALIRLALRKDRTHRIEIRCDPRNRASQRVIEKAGLRKEGHLRKVALDTRGNLRDLLVYAKLR